MKKKKPEKETIDYNVVSLQREYIDELKNNPLYSLEIDPLNKYDFSENEKKFIENYVQYKSILACSTYMGITTEEANKIYASYNVQKEIRRIHSALYQRQFANKLLDLDDIGGYLTSLLTDDFIPIADRLSTQDKLKVVDLLIKINQMKANGFVKPEIIIEKDINEELKELSVDAIKQLLIQKSNRNEKVKLISEFDKDNILTPEEKSYLETLSVKELLKLLDKGGE